MYSTSDAGAWELHCLPFSFSSFLPPRTRTYKNLEKRVILECDGEAIPLPSLQVSRDEISPKLANLKKPLVRLLNSKKMPCLFLLEEAGLVSKCCWNQFCHFFLPVLERFWWQLLRRTNLCCVCIVHSTVRRVRSGVQMSNNCQSQLGEGPLTPTRTHTHTQ